LSESARVVKTVLSTRDGKGKGTTKSSVGIKPRKVVEYLGRISDQTKERSKVQKPQRGDRDGLRRGEGKVRRKAANKGKCYESKGVGVSRDYKIVERSGRRSNRDKDYGASGTNKKF